jgi:hypothetical protein
LRLPKLAASEGPFYLRWNDQAEATLYVDGVPYTTVSMLRITMRRYPLRQVKFGSSQSFTRQASGILMLPGLTRWVAVLMERKSFRVTKLLGACFTIFLVLEDVMREELRAAFLAREIQFEAIRTKSVLDLISAAQIIFSKIG